MLLMGLIRRQKTRTTLEVPWVQQRNLVGKERCSILDEKQPTKLRLHRDGRVVSGDYMKVETR
jgi:hypothetical protein